MDKKKSKKVQKPQIKPESEVKHENLPLWILQCVVPSILFLLISFPMICLYGCYILLHHIFDIDIYLTIVLLLILSLYGGKQIYNKLHSLSKLSQSYETGETSILDSPYVHDTYLFTLAWNQSPYNPKSTDHDKQINDLNILTYIKKQICFQPKEGYCGHATINTVLRSLTSQWLLSSSSSSSSSTTQAMPMAIPFPRVPGPFNVNTLSEYLNNAISNSDDRNNIKHNNKYEYTYSNIRIKKFHMESNTTFEQFHSLMKKANNKDCRILVNFHRKPLFFSEYTTHSTTHTTTPFTNDSTVTVDNDNTFSWKAIRTIGGGHWSPIASVISVNKSQLYNKQTDNNLTQDDVKTENDPLVHMVLMLDVNSKYGPYMVPMDRLFKAVKTKESNGTYRGIIQLYINPSNDCKSKND